jgi:hypothetical protein
MYLINNLLKWNIENSNGLLSIHTACRILGKKLLENNFVTYVLYLYYIIENLMDKKVGKDKM